MFMTLNCFINVEIIFGQIWKNKCIKAHSFIHVNSFLLQKLASFHLNELSWRLPQAASCISLENFTLYTHTVCVVETMNIGAVFTSKLF